MTPGQTPTPHRSPSGSPEAAAQALAKGLEGWPALPTCLQGSEHAAALWRGVMTCRLADQWPAFDLENATNLVRCLRDIAEQEDAQRREGLMIGKGAKLRVNPRHQVIDTLVRRAAALTRLLTLHSVPISTKQHREGLKTEAGKAAETLAAANQARHKGVFNPDDLLARPRAH